MPSVGAAAAIAEMDYLERTALKVDKSRLRKRVSPVFNVFTQHLSDSRKKRALEEVTDSIYVIGEKDARVVDNDPFGGVGLNRHPVAYKRGSGVVEVSEPRFDEKGYLDWALVLKIGDMNMFNRIIPHYKIAADAVASFYLDMSSQGLPKEGDERKLWIAKQLIHIAFQGKGTRELAYRVGNQSKQMEQDKPGTGLQHIYERTR
ncbi:hypothetical protein ACFLZ7_01585 [Nanoarchaeota archaeon]